MNTKHWGPATWITLHSFSFGYPLEPTAHQKKEYKKFYTSVQNTLPCSYCRQSYREFLKILPIDNYLDTRLQLAYWVYLIHDMVNVKVMDLKGSPSFLDVVKKYEKMRAKRKK